MTQTYQDPKTYISTLAAKRGKSGIRGVYLTNVTIVAEASTDYGYKVNFSSVRPLEGPENAVREDWLEVLVAMRADVTQDPQCLSFKDGIYQFLPEGNNVSLNVFLPQLEVELFEYHVCLAQDLLQCLASFAGKVATTIRFNIGFVNRSWADLAEVGEVEERELSY